MGEIGYHKDIPRDLAQNLTYRQEVLDRAKGSNQTRRALKQACSEDILFFVNTFVWQFNPLVKGGEAGPFITYPFQEEALLKMDRCIETDEDVIIIKSREMGATWLALMLFDWRWLFRPWQKFLVMSRNEKAVEDEDPDSLFWKIDHLHRYLPDWLLPNFKRRKLFFGNEDTNSSITGTASTEKAGVGGRATAMFIDELSQIDDAGEVIDRTSNTTGCRIMCGTHKGVGTTFHKMCEKEGLEKIYFHWSQHPRKNKGLYKYDRERNRVVVLDRAYPFPPEFPFDKTGKPAGGPFPGIRSPWYDKECTRKKSQRGIAEDLDIDPTGSVAQFFDPLVIHQLRSTHTHEPYWQGDISYDKDTGKPISITRMQKGPLRLWFHPDKEGKFPPVKASVGIDVSTGQGVTNSVLSGFNARSGEKLLEYASPSIQPYLFAPLSIALCLKLRDEFGRPAFMVWEHDGPGIEFGYKVIEMGYGNIYMRKNRVAGPYTKQMNQPGWYPSRNEKRQLLEEYKEALEKFEYVNFSDFALEQCLPYRFNNMGDVEHPSMVMTDDPTGAKINHGDHVIADALSWLGARELGISRPAPPEEATIQVGSLEWRRAIHEARNKKQGDWHD